MKFSININTKQKINIPEKLDDKKAIDYFLNKNNGKKVIVVQGLGFVGAVMCLVCANSKTEDYAVIGVDLANEENYWKIHSINNGIFPIVSSDTKVLDYYEKSKERGNFYATYDNYAYSKADYIIVDINLDVKKQSDYLGNLNEYSVPLSGFKEAIKTIGNHCKENVLVLVETTVPPGTCQNIVKPIIDECFNKRNLNKNNFMLGHSYERVMPGPNYIDSIQNFYRVYSGVDEESAIGVELFLKTIISTKKFPLTRLSSTNSTEMAKVLENSYRAMNISFITEWSRFAEESEVNLYEVIDAIRMRPTHTNIMFPGIGVGGYCLTKDPLLASWSKKNIFNSKEQLKMSEHGVQINDKMPLYAFKFMKKSIELANLEKKNILLCGVSYRSDIADTRYSPVENFYKYCKNEGLNILLHDPFVKYWDELSLEVNNDLDKILENNLDIIVISTNHSEYVNNEKFINKLLSKKRLQIYDTVGVFSELEIKQVSKKHNLFILGRGDLKNKI